ncbi:MAG: tryptophan--tRNA ligase [Halobacteria archaeon]
MVELDPWGSSSVEDYRRLFREFGIEEFDSGDMEEPMDLMRRSIIFGQRDFDYISEAIENGDDFAALSGFMPSGRPHIGNMMVMRELIWMQEMGAETYFLIADLEAHSARDKTWEECREISKDYILSMIALGFEPETGYIYRQSENLELQDLAFELAEETNFNELRGIYGFDGETNIAHMESVLTQSADILYPQIEEPKPTVIPVGADQDPHLRLTRSLAGRMRLFDVKRSYASFEIEDKNLDVIGELVENLNQPTASNVREELEKRISEGHEGQGEEDEGVTGQGEEDEGVTGQGSVEDTGNEEVTTDLYEEILDRLDSAGDEVLKRRVRVLSRGADEEAFKDMREKLESRFEVEIFDEHVDVYGSDMEAVDDVVREVEVDHGGYGFYPPSSIYHRFMTGLTGGKMSSSVPESHIALTDEPDDGYDKVMNSKTGGRETAEEQREKGGKPDECPVYELYAYMLAEDDDHAELVYDECAGGERLCGGCKMEAADLMEEFLEEHQQKREEAKEKVEDFGVEL